MNDTTKREAAIAVLDALMPEELGHGEKICLTADEINVLRASLATPAVTDGYVLVPKTTTLEMRQAFKKAWFRSKGIHGEMEAFEDGYKALIYAAPKQDESVE